MCSLKLPDTCRTASNDEAVFSAIVDVVERSFFSIVDRCDEARFAELAATHADWLIATVKFEKRDWAGAVTCRLPAALAVRMCSVFVGGASDDLAPSHDQLSDMVGEFVNMICGAWLTRTANQHTFVLSTPVVVAGVGAATAAAARHGTVFAIDELPCSAEIQFFVVPVAAAART